MTPGPWKIASNGKNGETYRVWRNDPGQSEETNHGYACIAPHVHGIGNARLVAAAPKLLQTLVDVKLALDGLGKVDAALHQQIMTAISEAVNDA